MYYLTKKDGKWDKQSQEILDKAKDGSWKLDNSKKRSLDQNNALWRWDTELSQESGYTPAEVHYIMLGRIYGTKRVMNVDKPVRTSSDLNTVEFMQYVEIYPAVAQELFGITLSPFSYNKE